MSGFLLRVLNLLTFRRLERIEPMKEEASASAVRTREINTRNQRDYRAFTASGLDLPNINATLFNGQARGGDA